MPGCVYWRGSCRVPVWCLVLPVSQLAVALPASRSAAADLTTAARTRALGPRVAGYAACFHSPAWDRFRTKDFTSLEPDSARTLHPPSLPCHKQRGRRERGQSSRENPKPVKVEARVERQQGWAHAGQGARLGSSNTSAPSLRHSKPQTLYRKP